MSDNITINNSSQLIENEWLNLVTKYFPDDNISLLKAGFFGYVNEIMSQEIKNNVYHRNFIYDEYLLNTASTPKSIYNFAKIYDVDINNATPSRLSAVLSVREIDLPKEKVSLNNLSDNGNIEQSKIDRNTVFSLNGMEFMLPYDVQIIFNRNVTDSSKYVITARYMVEENEIFPYMDINNSILKTWDATYKGDNFIYIKVDLFQLSKVSRSTLVTNENNLYNTFYKFNFTGQLAYFNIYYEKDNVRERIRILSNNSYSLANNEKYCYYNIIDSNTLEISFSSLFNSFKPEYGSRLVVDIFTTKGSEGNLGNIGEMNSIYGSDFDNNIPIAIEPVSDCYGGTDKSGLLDIKKKIINKNLTRNAIITENDLNNFFNSINNSDQINNSEIRFIKKRNDVLRKIYGAYMLLRDTDNVILPTRTIESLTISDSQMAEMAGSNPSNVSIPERSLVIFDKEASNYFLATKEIELKKYINDSNYLIYSIPYLLNVNTENYLSAKYYKTYTNQDIDFSYKYVNTDIPYKFVISSCNVTRNSLENETYKLSLNFTTNLGLTEYNLSRIKIRGILKNVSGEAYGYFNFNRVADGNLLFEANLSSEKYDGIYEDKLNIYNSLYAINTEGSLNPDGTTSLQNCYLDEGTKLEIQILYKSTHSSYKYGEANDMPDLVTADLEQYASACVFENETDIELFKDVTKFIDSTVVPMGESNGLIIKSIPVIEYNYFKSNIVQIYRILNNFQNILEGNINRLECNTDIDMKFFNTHGPSKMLYTGFTKDNLTGNLEYKYLDRLDIDLNMTIYLNTYINEETKEGIARYISDYIESLNKKGVIAISNIISELERTFDVISYMEFNTINDNYYQKIVNIEYDGDIEFNFVPEYVNIRKGLSTITDGNNEEKKYKYSLTINYK